MPKFAVFLEGKGFPIVLEGKTQVLGFYTTRRVKAACAEAAELAAMDLVKNDPDLHALVDDSVPSDPQLYVENVEPLSWWRRLGGEGYAFYPRQEQ